MSARIWCSLKKQRWLEDKNSELAEFAVHNKQKGMDTRAAAGLLQHTAKFWDMAPKPKKPLVAVASVPSILLEDNQGQAPQDAPVGLPRAHPTEVVEVVVVNGDGDHGSDDVGQDPDVVEDPWLSFDSAVNGTKQHTMRKRDLV